jgi:hypothetical protein
MEQAVYITRDIRPIIHSFRGRFGTSRLHSTAGCGWMLAYLASLLLKMISFQFRTDLDPIAVYGAVVSTLGIAFSFVQWFRTGPRLTGHASGDMKLFPDESGRTYINMTVYNRGTRRTKITTIGLKTYPSRWARLRRKAEWAAVIPNPLHVQLPALLEPGDYIIAGMPQEKEMVDRSRRSILMAEIYYTDHARPLELRLLIKDRTS